jgi:hypothetical protein
MLTKIMKWVSVTALLLALLWPSSAGYPMLLLGICGLCVSILAAQASRAGKHFWEAGYTMVSREVKYEN